MKKLVVFGFCLALCFSSCIKSLYSIVGDGDRIIDDRIVGVWSLGKSISPIQNIKIETDNPEENIDSLSGDIFDLINSQLAVTQFWEIHRAADITMEYSSKDSSGKGMDVSVNLSNVPENSNDGLFKKIADTELKLVEKKLHDYYILKTTFSNDDFNSISEDDFKIVQMTKIGSNTYLDITERPHDNESVMHTFLHPNIPGHTIVKIDFEGENVMLQELNGGYIESLIKEKRIRLKHEMINDEIILTASTNELRSFLEKYGDDDKLFEDPESYAVADL